MKRDYGTNLYIHFKVIWKNCSRGLELSSSKIGYTREQLFHAWITFYFDENAETIDAYVQRIRQGAGMFNYSEPQFLEIFKNTLIPCLYWVLFPVKYLRHAVETAKRIINKEKLDRQLARQSMGSPNILNSKGRQRAKTKYGIVL